MQAFRCDNSKAYVKDISIPDDMYYDKFDRVLIDAPCSGLGVIRRKPDIKWSKSEADLHTLNKKQYELLHMLAGMLNQTAYSFTARAV